MKYVIQESKLSGEVTVSGAKNSVLRLLAATILTSDKITLTNYPSSLSDAKLHVEMLEKLGKKCLVDKNTIIISEENNLSQNLDWNKRSIRNTLLILGALVARYGKGKVPKPGGCNLGDRKYDLHKMVLENMGAKFYEDDYYLYADALEGLFGTEIKLPIRSTGATENAILCGCLAKGRTRIWNPHIRPEIIDLIDFLNKMGARIEVFGQMCIDITGVNSLGNCTHRVIPDNMEALTWLIATVITKGEVMIKDFPFSHLEVPLIFLRESGSIFYKNVNDVFVKGGECYPIEISTGPYPGINSDMQPLFAVYGSKALGRSKIIDLRFTNRYRYSDELRKMGVVSQVIDGALSIEGGKRIVGRNVVATDLRSGIALALAGLISHGTTIIEDAWQIERGYNDFFEKLTSLGGQIKRIE
jgi:UDP-N-acetylglucosamine 1-carboxyvinyltransferase